MKLTQKVVDALRPGDRRFVWDDSLSGFGVRITEGSVAYVIDFRLGSRRRRISLGSTKLKMFQEARDEALAARRT